MDFYDSKGRLLDGPDDPEYLWRCPGCGSEEYVTYGLPPGWEEVHIGPHASRYMFRCGACVAARVPFAEY